MTFASTETPDIPPHLHWPTQTGQPTASNPWLQSCCPISYSSVNTTYVSSYLLQIWTVNNSHNKTEHWNFLLCPVKSLSFLSPGNIHFKALLTFAMRFKCACAPPSLLVPWLHQYWIYDSALKRKNVSDPLPFPLRAPSIGCHVSPASVLHSALLCQSAAWALIVTVFS